MRPSMLLVGHGTGVREGQREFHALVARLRATVGPDQEVVGCFMESATPSIAEAVGPMCENGHRHLVALPLMLLAAGHSKQDIPTALRGAAELHPGLRFSYGRRLGPHRTLVTLLAERVDAVADGADGPGKTTVVLAGQGSTDPDGNAELAKVGRLLWEHGGYPNVEVAYLSTTTPTLTDALDRAATLGAARIVVAPHLLFSGVLATRARTVAEAWARTRPEVAVAVASPIGDCAPLADVVIERYQEALGGDIRMNCDTCGYR